MANQSGSVGMYYTWTAEPGMIWLRLGGACRTADGGEVVIPMVPATLRAMLATAQHDTAPTTPAAPLIPHGHPQRGHAELLYRWLSERRPLRSEIARSLDADACERWAQVVWCWLHDTAQHADCGALRPLPEPVGVQVQAEQPPDAVPEDTADRPAGLDGWPQPDPDESAALWQIRRVRQLLSEMAQRDPIALKGDYPTDLRDWVDRLAEVIRYVKRIERQK